MNLSSELDLLLSCDRPSAVRILSSLVLSAFNPDSFTSSESTSSSSSLLRAFSSLALGQLRRGRPHAFTLLNECSVVDEDTLRLCYMHCLEIFVNDAERHHQEEEEEGSNQFGAVAELMLPFEAEEVSKALGRMTERRASTTSTINWANMATAVKVLVRCFENGERIVKGE